MVSDARSVEVDAVINRFVGFADRHDEVHGLLLVGSWARGEARLDSDVDLVILAAEPSAFTPDTWIDILEDGHLIRRQHWGPLDEMRIKLSSGLEVEVGVVPLSWAATNPVDSGTHRVVTDGHRILHDRAALLDQLATACKQEPGSTTT